MTNLTAASTALFTALAVDADNWGGNPLVDVTEAEKGNLTDLKAKGLLTTFTDRGDSFASFTPEGRALAADLGIEL